MSKSTDSSSTDQQDTHTTRARRKPKDDAARAAKGAETAPQDAETAQTTTQDAGTAEAGSTTSQRATSTRTRSTKARSSTRRSAKPETTDATAKPRQAPDAQESQEPPPKPARARSRARQEPRSDKPQAEQGQPEQGQPSAQPSTGSGPSQHVPAGRARVVVVGPDGRPMVMPAVAIGGAAANGQDGQAGAADGHDGSAEQHTTAGLVDQPSKVMRIASMIKQLLDEVRTAPLDEAARVRLAEVHARAIRELEDGISGNLLEELQRLTLPLGQGAVPSDAELRIAQAQLVGWLEGLFQSIQTALVAQQVATQTQRKALPPGLVPMAQAAQAQAQAAQAAGGQSSADTRPGQYL